VDDDDDDVVRRETWKAGVENRCGRVMAGVFSD
jgi:hypothetical protein